MLEVKWNGLKDQKYDKSKGKNAKKNHTKKEKYNVLEIKGEKWQICLEELAQNQLNRQQNQK